MSAVTRTTTLLLLRLEDAAGLRQGSGNTEVKRGDQANTSS